MSRGPRSRTNPTRPAALTLPRQWPTFPAAPPSVRSCMPSSKPRTPPRRTCWPSSPTAPGNKSVGTRSDLTPRHWRRHCCRPCGRRSDRWPTVVNSATSHPRTGSPNWTSNFRLTEVTARLRPEPLPWPPSGRSSVASSSRTIHCPPIPPYCRRGRSARNGCVATWPAASTRCCDCLALRVRATSSWTTRQTGSAVTGPN